MKSIAEITNIDFRERKALGFTGDLMDHSTNFVRLFHLNKYRSESIE